MRIRLLYSLQSFLFFPFLACNSPEKKKEKIDERNEAQEFQVEEDWKIFFLNRTIFDNVLHDFRTIEWI